MSEYYPKEWLPQNQEEEKTWTPCEIVRAQTGRFYYFFYEKPKNLKAWIKDSGEHQARVIKTMAESFRRNNDVITFAIHLFIDAFPSGHMKAMMDCDRIPKPAFFAYKDAISPVMVSLQSDRHNVFAGEEIVWETWVSNDSDEFENAKLFYHVDREDGSVLCSENSDISCGELTAKFLGNIRLKEPKVSERENFKITICLLDAEGNQIHHNSETFTVFERTEKLIGKVFVIGDATGNAHTLAQDLGFDVDFGNHFDKKSLILIDNYAKYLEVAQLKIADMSLFSSCRHH